jgi:alanyl-tRNA synthetase
MDRKQLIKKYIEFFKSKDHAEIINSPLVPENDPTVLFTTAGMHPLVPFLLGEKHPQGKRLVNVQKCIRTGDIEEVGNTTHHTFFEMLGNWSVGDYFKKEAIEYSFEFLTKVLKLDKERLAVTVFAGDKDAPKDEEAAEVWEGLGIAKERIAFLEKEDNWWGPAGNTGPCGPDTEMFYWTPNDRPAPKKYNPEDKNWVEIWNDVLMQYNKNSQGKYEIAKQQNIDTGMGTERTVTILNGLEDNYLSDMWLPIIKVIEKLSGVKYTREDCTPNNIISMRIIADHIKASVMILADGVVPGNTEQGYVLRRLIRRAIREAKYNPDTSINMEKFVSKVAEPVFDIYDDYPHLQANKEKILKELDKEEENFLKTIEQGDKILRKLVGLGDEEKKEKIDAKTAFLLYQSYGYPIELTKEYAGMYSVEVDEAGFKKEFEKHQELSRTSTSGRFKSGLADNTEATTKLHTATHLLNQALRVVLKTDDIHQKGSNITADRLRFDFNFDRKLTPEELKEVEDLINEKIDESLLVNVEEMSVDDAKKAGAQGIFEHKYGDKIKVYSVGDFSKEICAGPHVANTKELGKFKIKKEESSSSGVRRIKAVLN